MESREVAFRAFCTRKGGDGVDVHLEAMEFAMGDDRVNCNLLLARVINVLGAGKPKKGILAHVVRNRALYWDKR